MLKDKAINSNIGWDTKKNLNKKITEFTYFWNGWGTQDPRKIVVFQV